MDNRRNFAKPVRDELRAGLGVQKPLGPIGRNGKRGQSGVSKSISSQRRGSQSQRPYFTIRYAAMAEVTERAVAVRAR